MIELGQVAYEAYRAAVDGVSLITGDRLPDWGDLREDARAAWRAAADAVTMYASQQGMRELDARRREERG